MATNGHVQVRKTSGTGARIRQARLQQQLTQPELAEALNVHLDTVRYWESGRRSPTDRNAFRIATLLHVDVVWLLDGEGTP